MHSRGTAALIADRIEQAGACLRTEHNCTAHAVIDDLLPDDLAHRIASAFPDDAAGFTRFSNFRGQGFGTNAFDRQSPLLREVAFAIQDPAVIETVSSLTGLSDLQPDPTCYAGGLSFMMEGDFQNPHLDNSHTASRALYRRLNLLYYLNVDWQPGNGGELELWDRGVRRAVAIEPRFNLLAIMLTDRASWHSVAPIRRNNRRCISTYYFSEASPDGGDYYHVTSYTGRPGQYLRRAIGPLDNAARQLARTFGARRKTDKGYRPAGHSTSA